MSLYGQELTNALRKELARRPNQSAPELCVSLRLGMWRVANVRTVLLGLVKNGVMVKVVDGKAYRFHLAEGEEKHVMEPQSIEYRLLGILQEFAPNGEAQQRCTDVVHKLQQEGASAGALQLWLINTLQEGITYGNWPWALRKEGR